MDPSGEGWLSVKLERNEYIQRGLKEREGHFRLEKGLVPKLGGGKPLVGEDLKLSGGESPWMSNQRTARSTREWLDSEAPMLTEEFFSLWWWEGNDCFWQLSDSSTIERYPRKNCLGRG